MLTRPNFEEGIDSRHVLPKTLVGIAAGSVLQLAEDGVADAVSDD